MVTRMWYGKITQSFKTTFTEASDGLEILIKFIGPEEKKDFIEIEKKEKSKNGCYILVTSEKKNFTVDLLIAINSCQLGT